MKASALMFKYIAVELLVAKLASKMRYMRQMKSVRVENMMNKTEHILFEIKLNGSQTCYDAANLHYVETFMQKQKLSTWRMLRQIKITFLFAR
jgi:hypothetical protein